MKNPLVVPIKASAKVLERKWISAIPKAFWFWKNISFVKRYNFIHDLLNEMVEWHNYLIIDDLHDFLVSVCFDLRL